MTHKQYEELQKSYKTGNKILIYEVIFVVIFITGLITHLN